ncbi:MAG: hypothetical protein GF341_09620 [candidate division Zixibacteria bacterium]|nr:hypothetical protein [candidate division Zixibacteria bacterium]
MCGNQGGGLVDPNKAYLPVDPWHDHEAALARRRRARRVETAVRGALRVLNPPERGIIEGYYFDGRSFPHLANEHSLSLTRVRTIHTRALSKLRHELTPLVIELYGLQLAHESGCPICRAQWRDLAEGILDEKTPDMTWGDVATRIERAVGWTPSTPQVLITHQRKHRQLQHSPKGDTR